MSGLLLLAAAGAVARAGVEVVVADGPLRPSRASVLEVAATGEGGGPEQVPPHLDVIGGTVKGPVAVRPGVWRWQLVPAGDADVVEVRAGSTVRAFPCAPPPASTLSVPAMVDAVVRGDPPTFRVTGSDLPSPEALVVVPAEGRVASVRAVDGALEVTLEPDDLPYPRYVPVGLRDARRDEAPAWTRVRMRARPPISLRSEPGAKLTLEVGGRVYGPFTAAANGDLDARVDQYPGEVLASALLVDDLGNETRTGISLVTQTAPSLVLVPTGEILPGRPPPLVHVWPVGADGRSSADPPTCRTPAAELAARRTGDGSFVVALPSGEAPEDVRLVCTAGVTSASIRVPVTAGVPRSLDLRVWPDELRTDFPTAEVRVALEDVRGDSMPVDGVAVDAVRGAVAMEPPAGMVARGEYDGAGAIEAGEDRIRARWVAPTGAGPVEELALGWGDVPSGAGTLAVHARALDALRRPLQGVSLAIGVEDSLGEARTGPDGWATVELPVDARDPVTLVVSSRWRTTRALVLPAEPGTAAPGAADLEDVASVRIRPGRIAGISLAVEPSTLRAGPGAIARIQVRLEDGSGQPLVDEPVEIEVSEGMVGELAVRADGSYVAEYRPLPIDAPRTVTVTARTETVWTSDELLLEPRVVRVSVGPWVGATTNFGKIRGAPMLGLDVDVRTRLAGEALMLRLGGAATSFRSQSRTLSGTIELRNQLFPVWAAVLFRQDRGPWAVWGGGGLQVAYHRLEPIPGEAGSYWLAGPAVLGGVGRRALAGEVVLGLRGSWMSADQGLGYDGNLGGLTAGLGYRLVY